VGPNQISAKLQQLDNSLTPERGLRPVVKGVMAAANPAIQLNGATRLLLLIHGTFSKGDMYMEELKSTREGRALLANLAGRYSHVCAFDHPTLSASTMVNGVNLETALAKSGLPLGTPIDVVCHSRGGLVAAWWARHTRFTVEKIVSAGATYQGTTLASPYRIRQLLDHFATVAKIVSGGLGKAATIPTVASGFLAGASGVMGVLGHITKGLSALPLADAGIALVPGLQSMSYVSNNLELDALWQDGALLTGGGRRELFVISSDYEPANDTPWWNLWQQLKSVPMRAANSAADTLFDGANDLVVDTRNMRPKEAVVVTGSLAYVTSDHVHHVNYFSQVRTVSQISKWLKIP
jgi:pimeloyl-ACP methyl ester carboxylesterase